MNVAIKGKDPEDFTKLVIPNGVEKLTLSYLAKQYPDSVRELEILNHKKSKEIWLPRSVESLVVGDGDDNSTIFRYRNCLSVSMLLE